VRSAVALPGLLLLLLCQEGGFPRLKRRDLRLFAAFGLVNGALYNIFYFTAVELVGGNGGSNLAIYCAGLCHIVGPICL